MTQYTGWLGWSNKRFGIDIYHSAEDGRHNHDERYGGHGHLLAFDMGENLEGHKVVVIVGDERAQEPGGAWVTVETLAAALIEIEWPVHYCDQWLGDEPCGTCAKFAAAIIEALKP